MKRYMPEKYQIGALKKFFQQQGFSYQFEATMYSIPIDILCRKKDRVIAIELKSRNKRRGVEQAMRNSYFADYSFLSVWEENVTPHLVNRLKDKPIGLIAVGDKIKFVSPPNKNKVEEYPKEKALEVIGSGI